MLQQFTWGAFLLASFVLSFLWYCFVLLVFYRREVFGLFGDGLSERLPHRWEKGLESLEENAGGGLGEGRLVSSDSLMGRSAMPEGMAVLGMGQLSFGGNPDGRYEQVGLVADVIQELKLIFARLEKEAGSKLDFFRMLEKVKEDYGKIGAHPNVGAINEFIAAHVPFHLSSEELENLWY
ncbi:hypothetical protein GM921_09765 [Pedobacter sp. LMG 31464]|uniref:Uncharacterized protein n=1 Tax=Pedobacter planticolens TaxID=2679964 RepID=A0A923E0D6_9SPHI|nr:hypothetical protein [Pedobacter planticolens]MBB2145773.1 hypothetical protein [Pedobacter planticolens]